FQCVGLPRHGSVASFGPKAPWLERAFGRCERVVSRAGMALLAVGCLDELGEIVSERGCVLFGERDDYAVPRIGRRENEPSITHPLDFGLSPSISRSQSGMSSGASQ